MLRTTNYQTTPVCKVLKKTGLLALVGLSLVCAPILGQESVSESGLQPLFDAEPVSNAASEVRFSPIPPMTDELTQPPLRKSLSTPAISDEGTPLFPVESENKTSTAKISHADDKATEVRQVSHSLPVAELPGMISQSNQATPFSPVVSATTPVAKHAPMIYRLTILDGQAMQQKMLSRWSDRMKTSESQDGRFVRLLVPNTSNTEFWPMMIDRVSNSITFEGKPADERSWRETIESFESADVPTPIMAQNNSVSAAARIATVSNEPNRSLQPQSVPVQQASAMSPSQDDRVRRSVPVTPEIAEQLPGELEDLQGKVQLQVVDGMLNILGSPEDVEAVLRKIDEITRRAAAGASTVEEIQLKSAVAQKAAETVQELYDETFEETNGPASIKSVDAQNKLIIGGSPSALREIRKIVEMVDGEVSGEVPPDFEVFALRHISVIDAQERINQYFGKSQNLPRDAENDPPPSPVISIADFRSNKLIVKGSPGSLKQVANLLKALDVDDSPTVSVVKIFPLTNTLASDLQPILQDILNGQLGGGQGPTAGGNQTGTNVQPAQAFQFQSQNVANLKSTSLDLITPGPNGERVKGSVMFDVRVTPNPNSNSLIVTGPEKGMDLIQELINQLDVLPDVESQIKVFKIHNGEAELILETLLELFGNTGNQGGGGGQNQNNTTLPLQSASGTDGQSIANLNLTFDSRTNSIIAAGPVGDLIVVEDLISRLDEEGFDRRVTRTYRLSNLSANDMAEAIEDWLSDRDDINSNDPTIGGDINLARRSVSVTPLEASNNLIVSAVPEYFNEVISVIQKLDRRPPMIKVKALIAEVNLNVLEEFGMDIGLQDSLLFDRGAAEGIGFNFNQSSIGNGFVQPEQFAGQVLSNLGVGRTNSSVGYGGLVFSAGSESISVLIRALKDKNCLRVLSKPTITTLENLQGRVSVGASVPRITQSTQNAIGGGISNSVEDIDVGVTLSVTPRVSPDGTIVMFVDITKSSLGLEADGVPVAVNPNGDVVRQAPINQATAQSTIQARSGQTVVFSGLVQEEKSHAERGAPILSDLPVIGSLFKFENDTAQRSELIIILTPYIVDSDIDVEMQNEDEMQRMHWCLNDVSEIYGNTKYDARPRASSPQVIYPDMDPTGMQNQCPAEAGVAPGGSVYGQQPPASGYTQQYQPNN